MEISISKGVSTSTSSKNIVLNCGLDSRVGLVKLWIMSGKNYALFVVHFCYFDRTRHGRR